MLTADRDEPAAGTGRAAEFRAAAALLREGGWVLALLGVIVLSLVFVLLGRWQFSRHEDKVERRARIAANYDAAPVALAEVLATPEQPLAAAREWTPVRVSGTYRVEDTVLVRNRPLDTRYGFEVLVPLVTDDGRVLMVDRGWVPNGSTSAQPDRVPAPPSGRVEVSARLRPGEPGVDRQPPPGQQLRIDLDRIAEQIRAPLGTVTYRAYGLLATERPAPAATPQALPRPEPGLGINLSYALQWWGFAAAAYVVLGHYMLREVRRRGGLPSTHRSGRHGVDEEFEDRLQG